MQFVIQFTSVFSILDIYWVEFWTMWGRVTSLGKPHCDRDLCTCGCKVIQENYWSLCTGGTGQVCVDSTWCVLEIGSYLNYRKSFLWLLKLNTISCCLLGHKRSYFLPFRPNCIFYQFEIYHVNIVFCIILQNSLTSMILRNMHTKQILYIISN